MLGTRRHRAISGTAARNLAKRKINACLKQARTAEFLKVFEQLTAAGYWSDPGHMVLHSYGVQHHLLRDLPTVTGVPFYPYIPTSRASTEGAKLSARSASLAHRLLNGRDPNKVLADADPDEVAMLGKHLPGLLEARDEKREAQARSSDAWRYRERLRKNLVLMRRLHPYASSTSAQRQRVQGSEALFVEAGRTSRRLRGEAEVESLLYRQALGLPRLRPRSANVRRYRLAPGRQRHSRSWEIIKSRRSPTDLRKGSKKPPRWRDLHEVGIIYMCVGGAYQFGRVVGFSVNLTEAEERKARSKPHPAAWLRDRISRYAKHELGRTIELLVVLEINEKGRLHAHGVAAPLTLIEEGAFETALRLAGGKGYRGPQVRLSANQPDSGWCSYLVKDFDQEFDWKRFASTKGMQNAATLLFDEVRSFVLAYEPPVPRSFSAAVPGTVAPAHPEPS